MEQNPTYNNIEPADKTSALTEREQAFIINYCQYRNAARAAREAGYSAKTAKQIGYENLTKPYIVSALSTLMEAHGMTVGECIGRLTAWARGSMEPFLTKRGELTLTSVDAVENRHLLKKVKQKKTTRTTPSGEVIEELQTEIELHDAKDAVDKMLQIHGRYKQLPGDANQPKEMQGYKLPDGTTIIF
ncbi:terminase small subunit [Spirosoma rigui]|uniref:terminase small subunit n=1 Tax=Spirosoma rigui TaxID=564064 RepID=UPI0009B09DF8|nr:terminase small subunit [Spirosoma rigui]